MLESYFSVFVFIFNIEVDVIELKVFRVKLIDIVKELIGVKLIMIDLIVMVVFKIFLNY